MICPQCRKNLRLKDRPNQTCTYCHSKYALDPRSNTLLVHDLQLFRNADRLSETGRFRYTGVQLWYALSRKALRKRPTGGGGGCGWGVAILVLIVASSCGFGAIKEGDYGLAAVAAIFWLAVIAAVIISVANRRGRVRTIEMPMSWSNFHNQILRPWHQLYGADPSGLAVAKEFAGRPSPADPVLAVLCPDRSVLFCLQANGIPERLQVAIVDRPKSGMRVPVQQRLRGPLRELSEDVLLGPTTRARGLFQPQTIRSWLRGEGSLYPRQGGKLWLVLTLELWLRSYVDA